MKLLLLKILFINQPKDKGYVIPIVFALGLIMTLVGTISIFQSSDEQIISISQRESLKLFDKPTNNFVCKKLNV